MGSKSKAYNAQHAGGAIDGHSTNQHRTGLAIHGEVTVARFSGEGKDKASKAERRREAAQYGEVTISATLELENAEIIETLGVLTEDLNAQIITPEVFEMWVPTLGLER